MKIEEIKTKTDPELVFDLGGLKKELFELRFKARTSSSASPARIRALRRAIARVNTVIKERGTKGQPVPDKQRSRG